MARNSSPGPGPVHAPSDVSLRQQLLLLNAGASKIVCLCSILALISGATLKISAQSPSPDETFASRARLGW